MCGIAGFLDLSPRPAMPPSLLTARARAMAGALVHRGPDAEGVWADPAAGIGLGFRRLAIIDLSPAGHQPMESTNGRLVIVFNGEIYNHRDLRRQLVAEGQADQFRGRSDTEILLAAIEAWGLRTALERAVGMFALAVWDRRERVLSLARDRVGEKPLYYGLQQRTLLFASELKSLQAHPAFSGEIDREALALFIRHGYIPAPHSIYQRIFKLLPGSLVQFPAPLMRQSPGELPQPVPYWSASQVAEAGARDRFVGSFAEAAGQLEKLIRASIADQMVADVPVGAFLSGGIDSSTIVALMQAQTSRRVKTFSIGFHESDYNEAQHARAVANHLGTDHTELYVTAAVAQAVIPQLPAIYDEPFADSSQIPTYLVAQLAREQVTVSLSGDGGDELFAGYTRYAAAQGLWKMIRILPRPVRGSLARLIRSMPAGVLDALLFWLGPLSNRRGGPARISSKLYRLAELMNQRSIEELYRSLVSFTGFSGRLVPGATESLSILSAAAQGVRLEDAREKMMYLDLVTYLPDDILVKVDRAAMAHGLETRVPLLDHRLIEFAGRLPMDFKQRDGSSKAVLRQVLAKYVPPELTERPKMGFGVPVGLWLRGPLRNWAEGLLDARSLAHDGLLDVSLVRRMWHEHVSRQREWQYQLWAVLMFQAWRAQQCQTTLVRAA